MKDIETYTFGNSAEFQFQTMQARGIGKTVARGMAQAERVTIDEADYHRALDDINSSFRVVSHQETGASFEIAVANLDATDDYADAEISTFSSSMSGNIGNAVEFAEHAALNPNRRRIYIASPGNGGSSFLTPAESQHMRQTGQATYDGQPLPTLQALADVLQADDSTRVSRLTANSAGCFYANGLMTALPEGQVDRVYLKSMPNIENHATKLGWAIRFMIGETSEGKHYKQHTQDEWELTDELIADARQQLGRIYDAKSGTWSKSAVMQKQGMFDKLVSDAIGLSRGGHRNNHPGAHNIANAVRNQPEAAVTLHLPHGDRLYRNVHRGAAILLEKVAELAPDAAAGQIQAVLLPGTHHDHSQYPGLRWSIENYAFSRELAATRDV